MWNLHMHTHTSRWMYRTLKRPTVFVNLTPSTHEWWSCSCLSAWPRQPTRLSLYISPFRWNAKLWEGKSTSVSHAFLLLRVYASQFWWTRTLVCDSGVNSPALWPWAVPTSQPSIKRENVSKHTRCLSLQQQIGFFKMNINELILRAIALVIYNFHKLGWYLRVLRVMRFWICRSAALCVFVCASEWSRMCVGRKQFYILFPQTVGEALVSKELQLQRTFPYLCLFSTWVWHQQSSGP